MNLVALAERLARTAHAGQRDFVGEYHEHLARVVARVEGDEAKAVAWLHDVLEDTPTTSADLLQAGISQDVVKAVLVLTRPTGEMYRDYIRFVRDSGNAVAIAVKIADLHDHLRPLDPPVISRSMRRRYEHALAMLV